MNYYFKCTFLFFLFCSCQDNNSVYVTDSFEGEKLFIDAEMSVGQPLSVYITRTFNPVLDELPTELSINDAIVRIAIDNIDTVFLEYNPSTSLYESHHLLQEGKCYTVLVDYKGVVSYSNQECIPHIGFKVSNVQSTLVADSAVTTALISLAEVESNRVMLGTYLSASLFMLTRSTSSLDVNQEECGHSEITSTCLPLEEVSFTQVTRFRDVQPSISDSIFFTCSYIPSQLEALREANGYNNGAYDLNSEFTSSFSNSYGIFGYTVRLVVGFPIID